MNTLYPPQNDLAQRWDRIRQELLASETDACLVASTVGLYYLTGRTFDGYVFLPAQGEVLYFVRKPADMAGANVVRIRKPEDIPALLTDRNISLPRRIALETDQQTYNEVQRLQKVFSGSETANATAILRRVRMIKTPWEIEQFRISAQHHSAAYARVAALFCEGMTDVDFQIEIEQTMRREGSIGIFRAFGSNMDIFMGSVLTGENAAAPSHCDFALGGGGVHPSIAIGANGTKINPGQTVMVDMAGNFTAYLTDMTRVFAYGRLTDEAYRAHEVSIAMHDRLMAEAKPGTACADIYNWSLAMAQEAGLSDNFMGTLQQAKFVGHGVGIEINELPVLMGRSKDLLQPGMVFAFEPKFVLPQVGAVGNENTYLVTETGLEKLTLFDEQIIPLG